jgi:hypothetical protein
MSTLNIVFAGVLLSLPFLLTGELAIPIGLHTTWNLFQGTVYGFPVSGSAPTRRLLVLEQGGPELWTGGAFGPEAGLVGLAWTLIGCVLVVVWVARRRGGLGLHRELAQYEPRTRPDEPVAIAQGIVDNPSATTPDPTHDPGLGTVAGPDTHV